MSYTESTILVVEDDSDLSEIIKTFLIKNFPNVLTVNNGAAALELLKTITPDLIVSDIHMPVMGGINLLKNIRSQGRDIPIIFMSSSQERDDVIEALRLGANDFVEKPFKRSDLEQTVFRVLEIYERSKMVNQMVANGMSENEQVKHNKKMIGLFKVAGAIKNKDQ